MSEDLSPEAIAELFAADDAQQASGTAAPIKAPIETPQPVQVQGDSLGFSLNGQPVSDEDAIAALFEEDEKQKDAAIASFFEKVPGSPYGQSVDINKRAIAHDMMTKTGAPSTDILNHFDEFVEAWDQSQRDPRKYRQNFPELARVALENPEAASIIVGDQQLSAFAHLNNKLADFGDWADQELTEAGLQPISAEKVAENKKRRQEQRIQAKPQNFAETEEVKDVRAMNPLIRDIVIPFKRYQEADKQMELSKLQFTLLRQREYGASADAIFETQRQIHDLKRTLTPGNYQEDALTRVFSDGSEAIASQVHVFQDAGAGAVAGAVAGYAIGARFGQGKRGAKIGAGLLGRAAGFEASLRLEAGGAYGEFSELKLDNGQPLSDEDARHAALGYGFLAAGVELGGFEVGLKAFTGAAGRLTFKNKLKDAGFRQAAMQLGKAWLKAGAGEMGEEGVQAALQQFSGYLAVSKAQGKGSEQQYRDTEEVLLSMQKGAVGGLAMGTAGLVITPMVANARRNRALLAGQQLAALAGLKDSPTVVAAPELAAEIIRDQTAKTGAPLTHVYVDPNELTILFQGAKADPKELLGDDAAERLKEAAATGTKVEVPIAEYLSTWSNKELDGVSVAEALQIHTTTAPNLPTLAEQKVLDKQEEAKAKAVEKLAQELVKQYDEKAEGKGLVDRQVLDRLQQQLVETGVYDKKTADHAMAPMRAMMETAAKLFGTSVDELFANVVMAVEREGGPVQQAEPVAPPTPKKPKPTADQLKLLFPDNETLKAMRDDFTGADSKEQLRRFYIDSNTGLLNKRALTRMKRPEGRPVLAKLGLDGAKLLNDYHGHESLDGALRAMAVELRAAGIGDAARVGGDIELWVKSSSQAADIARKLSEKLGLPVIHGAAEGLPSLDKTREAAGNNAKGRRDEGIKKKKYGHRKGAPVDLLGKDAPAIAYEKNEPGLPLDSPEAQALLSAAAEKARPLAEKYKAALAARREALTRGDPEEQQLTDDLLEAFETMEGDPFDLIYREDSGLLTEEGFELARKLRPKKYAASADMRALAALNEVFGKAGADAVLDKFKEILAAADRGRFDAAHPHGDEFLFQADDEGALADFFAAVQKHAAKVIFVQEQADGGVVVHKGIQFVAGVGKTLDEADRVALPRAKKAQGKADEPVRFESVEAANAWVRKHEAARYDVVRLARKDDQGHRRDGASAERRAESSGSLSAEEVAALAKPTAEAITAAREHAGRMREDRRDWTLKYIAYALGEADKRPAAPDTILSPWAIIRTLAEDYGVIHREDLPQLLQLERMRGNTRKKFGAAKGLDAANAEQLSRVARESRKRRSIGGPARNRKEEPETFQEEALSELDEDNDELEQPLFQGGLAEPTIGPVWFSAVEKAAQGAKQEKGDGKSWLAVLSKTPGVKKEELDLIGVPQWLAEQKGSITRQQVVDFIRANRIEVKEKVLGAPESLDRVRADSEEQFNRAGIKVVRGEDGRAELEFTTSGGRTVRGINAVIKALQSRAIAESGDQEGYHPPDYGWVREEYGTLLSAEQGDPDFTDVAYSDYATPGGTRGSYRELLFYAPGAESYEAPHFDDDHRKGLTAHARFQEHTLASGQKVLLIDEIQSDLHQAGRDKGYQQGNAEAAAKAREHADRIFAEHRVRLLQAVKALGLSIQEAERIAFSAEQDPERAADELNQLLPNEKLGTEAEDDALMAIDDFRRVAIERDEGAAKLRGVPDAPFKDSWETMVVRRLVRWAAENGYEKVAWTTGDMQADRYSLSQQVSALRWTPVENGAEKPAGILAAFGRQGGLLFERNATEEELPSIIGKDAARSLLEAQPDERGLRGISGIALKMGGEGMKTAYDQRIPSIVKKVVGKFGGEVKREPLKSELASAPPAHLKEELDPTPEVWTATIPAALRETVLTEGMPLFSGPRDPNDPTGKHRGYVQFNMPGNGRRTFRIRLSKDADASTFLHESGHVFLELLADLAERPDAPERVKQTYADALKALGVTKRSEVKREHHEKFAESFEKYLRKGKSPSPQLEGAFAAFRAWLLALYRAFRDDVLSEDIRSVFDRMLATDEEIDRAARGIGMRRIFATPEEAGMTPEEWQQYLKDQEKATSYAKRQLELRALQDRARETEAWWKDELAKEAKAAEALYEDLPARKAQKFLKGESELNDTPVILNREEVEAAVGPTQARKFRTAAKGSRIDSVASIIGGWKSGQEMLAAIAQLPSMEKWTREHAEQLMRQKHGDIFAEKEKLREAAEKGVHGDFTSAWFAREMKALRKKAGLGGDMPLDAIKRAAMELVKKRRLGSIRPNLFLQAERSAARKAFDRAAQGDFLQAYLFRQQQLLNHYMYKAAVELLEETDAAFKYLQKRTGDQYRADLNKASAHYLNLHDGILAALGMARQYQDTKTVLASLEAAIIEATNAGNPFAFDIDDIRALLVTPQRWSELLPEKALNVRDAVQNIRALANEANESRLFAEKMAIEEVAEKIATESAELNPDLGKKPAAEQQVPKLRKGWDKWLGIVGETMDAEEILTMLGPTAKTIFDRYLGAKTRKYELAAELLDPLVKQWQELPAETMERRFDVIKELDQDLPIPEDINLGGVRDRLWLLMVALNSGNASNMERLAGGFGWGEQQVIDTLNKHLTKDEWAWVTSIWKLMDEKMYPLVAEKEQRKTGLAPEKIQARPFLTPYGMVPGGYFPAVYEAAAAIGDIGERQEQQAIASLYGPGYVRASTLKSHTKERAVHYENVMRLDWSVVPSHFAQVLHDVAFDEFVRDTGRVIFHPKVEQALYRRLGAKRANSLRDWLKFVANAQANAGAKRVSETAGILGALKSILVIGAIGWSIPTAMGDFANAFVAMARGRKDGGTDARWGVPAYLAALPLSPTYGMFRRMAVEKSQELKNRLASRRDEKRQQYLAGIKKKQGKLSAAREAIANTAWFFQEQTDKMASTQIWLARYWQEKSNGKGEQQAVELADEAVRNNLPSPEKAEQSALVRDPGTAGAALVFFGYFAKLSGIVRAPVRSGVRAWMRASRAETSAERWKLSREASLETAKVAGKVAAIFFFAGVVGELLSGRGPEEDEEKEDWLFRKMMAAPLTLIPFGANFEPFANQLFGKKYRKASIRAAPALSVLESVLTNVGKAVDDEKDDGERAWAAIEVLLTAAGLPAKQPVRTGKFIEALVEDEERAEGIGEVNAGLMYGERKNQPDNPVTFFSR